MFVNRLRADRAARIEDFGHQLVEQRARRPLLCVGAGHAGGHPQAQRGQRAALAFHAFGEAGGGVPELLQIDAVARGRLAAEEIRDRRDHRRPAVQAQSDIARQVARVVAVQHCVAELPFVDSAHEGAGFVVGGAGAVLGGRFARRGLDLGRAEVQAVPVQLQQQPLQLGPVCGRHRVRVDRGGFDALDVGEPASLLGAQPGAAFDRVLDEATRLVVGADVGRLRAFEPVLQRQHVTGNRGHRVAVVDVGAAVRHPRVVGMLERVGALEVSLFVVDAGDRLVAVVDGSAFAHRRFQIAQRDLDAREVEIDLPGVAVHLQRAAPGQPELGAAGRGGGQHRLERFLDLAGAATRWQPVNQLAHRGG